MARTRRVGAVVVLLGLLVALPGVAAGAGAQAAACVTFPETGQQLCDRFLDQWNAHGGLAINGFPLTPEIEEVLIGADGQARAYRVQYFERVRMEYHPEIADPRFQVLLGQFGRRIHPADPPVAAKPGLRFFAQTGHNMAPDLVAYWEANGGLDQFGYPLTEEIEETLPNAQGQLQKFMVQYTERARFERHPENQPPNTILLGQFGRRILAEGGTPPVGWGAALPQLSGGTAHGDQHGRFTARYPRGWNVVSDNPCSLNEGNCNVNFLQPNGYAGINVSARPVVTAMTLDQYREADDGYLLPRLKDYRLISDTKVMVGPYPGYKRVYTHTNLEGQHELIVRYFFRAPGYVFVVNCFTLPHDEALYMPSFDGLTGTIVAK